MRRWNERCLELEETYDAHTGHPIGGMAHRLGSELSWHIDEDERRLKAADDEFEACRAQMIRELEGV